MLSRVVNGCSKRVFQKGVDFFVGEDPACPGSDVCLILWNVPTARPPAVAVEVIVTDGLAVGVCIFGVEGGLAETCQGEITVAVRVVA